MDKHSKPTPIANEIGQQQTEAIPATTNLYSYDPRHSCRPRPIRN